MTSFIYSPLPPGHIRLLRVSKLRSWRNKKSARLWKLLHSKPARPRTIQYSCTTHHVGDPNLPPYVAISYCWGDPERNHTIDINGEKLGVTQSVYELLRSKRVIEDGRYLWIDAICIDQGTVTEREQQIMLMNGVYSRADLVRVWLGEGSEDSHNAMNFATKLQPLIPTFVAGSWTEAEATTTREEWDSLRRLFERPWFERIWVIQEIVLAKEAEFVCGDDWLPWQVLGRLPDHCKDLGILGYLTKGRLATLPQSLNQLIGISVLRQDAAAGYATSTIELLQPFIRSKATDPRDKVYGLLGLSETVREVEFDPSYTDPPHEVYTFMTKLFIRQDASLELLLLAGTGWKRGLEELPSWVPDFSFSQVKQFVYAIYSATKDKEPDVLVTDTQCEFGARGIIFDSVEEVGSVFPVVGQEPDDGVEFTRFLWLRQANVIFNSSPSGATLESVFKTLIRGDVQLYHKEPTDVELDYKRCLQDIELDFLEQYETMEELNRLTFYGTRVDAYSRQHRCFRTRDGRIGQLPVEAKIGDEICVLYGLGSPFIIRPRETVPGEGAPKYELVGACYVYGIMDGEVLDLGIEDQMLIFV